MATTQVAPLSFPEDYDVEEREGGKDVKITHKKFRALTALTIGMDPAYKQTSVNARELYDETPAGKKAKQEAEAQKQREQEKQSCTVNQQVADANIESLFLIIIF